MEEDEEVILHNSPLDTYLQEVTDSEFSTYGYDNGMSLTNRVNSMKNEIESESINTSCCKHNVRNIEIMKVCKTLLDSSLLNEDDMTLLMDLKDDITVKMSYLSDTDFHKRDYSYTFKLFMVSVAVCTFSFLILYIDYLFVLFIFCIFGITIWRYQQKWVEIDPNQNEKQLLSFISMFHRVDKLIDKSIIHIKEVEVINSGFKMFRQAKSNEFTGKKGNKCLKLRNVLLDFIIDLFQELRVNQRLLLQTHTDELFTVKEEFFASIPLTKFHELISHKESNNLLNLPHISLDKLKAMVFLYRALLSEFTLTLVVCFYNLEKTNCNDLLHSLNQIAEVSSKHLTSLEQALKKSIQLTFKTTEIDGMNRSMETKTKPIDQKFNKCRLNLHSALKRIEESESLISEDSISLNLDTLENLFLQFYMSIDNAKACVEDILEVYKPRNPETSKAPECEEPTLEKGDTNLTTLVELPKQEEGDMLYEGESVDAPSRNVEPLDIEDLEQQLKESRESKRLLRELKSIFAVKASPEGLLSFPLQKVEEQKISNEQAQEPDIEKELITLRLNKKRAIASGDKDFCGEGEENLENRYYIPKTPIGLSASLLQGLSSFTPVQEEKFGSSDEDDIDS